MKSLVFLISFAIFSPLSVATDLPPSRLRAQDKEILNEALLQAFVIKFNRDVHDGNDLNEFFAKVPAKHKQGLQSLFASLGPAPKISRDGKTLTLTFPEFKMQMRWPDLKLNQVYIDGVSWTFDPTAPMKDQFEMFNRRMKKLSAQEQHASFPFSLIPSADAGPIKTVISACAKHDKCIWAATIAGTTVVGKWSGSGLDALGGVLYDTGCWIISPFKPWKSIGWCRPWKKAQDEWAEYESATSAPNKDPGIVWGSNGSAQCPKDEKGNETFDAWFNESKKKANGDWDEKTKYYHFIGKSKETLLTEAYILPSDQKNPKDFTNAEVKFVYSKTEKPLLQKIEIKKKTDDKDKDDYLSILMTDKPADIPVTYRDDVKRYKSLAAAAQEWVITCRTIAQASKVKPDQTEDAIKSMKNQPDVPTTSPTAPATQ